MAPRERRVPGRTGTSEGQRLARVDGHRSRVAALDAERVAERAPEAIEPDFHDVTVLEPHAVAEAQRAGAEVMDVDVAGPPVGRVLEMVVLDIAQAVAHL